jgi:hypothetical protein
MAITHKITKDLRLIDAGTNIVDGVGERAIRTQQEVPAWFIDQLREIKSNSAHNRDDWQLACSIPVVVHHQWLKEGFDCTREPVDRTIARLKALHLDHFVATTKQL